MTLWLLRKIGNNKNLFTIQLFIDVFIIFYRQEFVDLYVDFIFNKAVKDQFVAFQKGFMKVRKSYQKLSLNMKIVLFGPYGCLRLM